MLTMILTLSKVHTLIPTPFTQLVPNDALPHHIREKECKASAACFFNNKGHNNKHNNIITNKYKNRLCHAYNI